MSATAKRCAEPAAGRRRSWLRDLWTCVVIGPHALTELARLRDERYIAELEGRLRAACEPCAECGHIDYRELDDVLERPRPATRDAL